MTLAHADYRMACRARLLTLSVATTDGDYARASTATYTDIAGVVQTAAVDAYRGAHYVNAVLTPLYEAAGTNLLRYSEAIDNAAWNETTQYGHLGIVANASVAPDGAMAADTVQRAGQTYTPSGTGAHRFSIYVKANGATTGSTITDIALVRGPLANATSSTITLAVRLTWSGSVPTAAIFSGLGTLLTTEALAGGWYRVGGYAAVGTDTYYFATLVNSFGTTDFWGADVRAGSTMDSYVPSTTAPATRAADTNGLSVSGSTYARGAGSFLADGFRAGMEVTPAGFTDTTRRMVTAVSALSLTVNGTPTAQTLGAGRTLSVLTPARRSYENTPLTPVATAPYVAERYFPGTLAQFGATPRGWMEATGIYQVDFHVPDNVGPDALDRYADALTLHFPPTLALTTGDGTTIRVRGDGGLSRSPVLPSPSTGFRQVSVSVPIRVYTPNTL